jgi:RNA polymerase sigma factor (sigma-70 family)
LTDKLDDIIAGCTAGKRQSQEELYRMLSPKMFAVCLQYASDADEASDFLQEGFVRVFTRIKSYRGEGSFEGWVRKIIVNTALQFIRKKRQLYVVNEEMTADVGYQMPHIYYELEAEDLLRMIKELPLNQRIVFNLYAIEGYNHAEIESMTGMPENTSKSHLHRARIALKKMLDRSIPSGSKRLRKNV